jgi:hypothetical protein
MTAPVSPFKMIQATGATGQAGVYGLPVGEQLPVWRAGALFGVVDKIAENAEVSLERENPDE